MSIADYYREQAERAEQRAQHAMDQLERVDAQDAARTWHQDANFIEMFAVGASYDPATIDPIMSA
jgi:hypothetical protein